LKNYFDFGGPNLSESCHIGLYQPILDCFLLTLSSQKQAQDVVLIASSRYAVTTIDLTSAKNYSPHLIDNLCCENWHVPEQIEIDISFDTFCNLHTVTNLVNKSSPPDCAVLHEKKYLEIVWYYVRYFDEEIFKKNCTNLIVRQFMSNVLNKHDRKLSAILELKHAVYKTLYLHNDDLEVMCKDIDKLFLEAAKTYENIVF